MTSSKKRENSKRWYIRQNLPHQVALPNDLCCMENYDLLERYCRRFEPRPKTQQVTGNMAERQARGLSALLRDQG
ncbi:hypothetical protein GGQ99_001571 [Aminobacter niigataensis]|uniref:Uncharacterized protein n=1 Tax=Aminobacter niigataensis TaxID=83265 RepID=A0ABR6KZA5_9HYPH|nr:hypothetical protein [Aminobacter niigataensis]MBB4649849.1 hypothetical protein [Aminobacter niigataensis]